MAYMYCTSCGAKLQYSVSKPKFCAECGESIDGVTASVQRNVSNLSSQDEGSFIRPKGLDYEVIQERPEKLTLGSVIGTDKNSKPEARPTQKKLEDPLKESVNSCKSTRDKRDG